MGCRQTAANTSTQHFNPKLSRHRLHELQRDNKAVGEDSDDGVPLSQPDRIKTIVCAKCVLFPPSSLQVESPLAVEAVLGESAFSVTDEKVSITEMRVHAVSGLTLSLQPSPGNSHTMVAKATGLQTLTAPKQVHKKEKKKKLYSGFVNVRKIYI